VTVSHRHKPRLDDWNQLGRFLVLKTPDSQARQQAFKPAVSFRVNGCAHGGGLLG
jgi:hypothetical protein